MSSKSKSVTTDNGKPLTAKVSKMIEPDQARAIVNQAMDAGQVVVATVDEPTQVSVLAHVNRRVHKFTVTLQAAWVSLASQVEYQHWMLHQGDEGHRFVSSPIDMAVSGHSVVGPIEKEQRAIESVQWGLKGEGDYRPLRGQATVTFEDEATIKALEDALDAANQPWPVESESKADGTLALINDRVHVIEHTDIDQVTVHRADWADYKVWKAAVYKHQGS